MVNIHPKLGGRNFHTESLETDLVILCSVFNPSDQSRKYVQYDQDIHLRGRFAISPYHFEKDIWHNSAARSGAKMLTVIGGGDEINESHFLPEREGQFAIIRQEYNSSPPLTLLKHKTFHL
jgi:hypothetical protein